MPATDIVSFHDAAHLLRRAGFGGSKRQARDLKGLTRAEAVASVMDFGNAPRPPEHPNESEWQQNLRAQEWWLTEMATGADPLREKMTLFWHGHFATSWDKVDDQKLMNDQNHLFRTKGMGDLAELCTDVSLGPAMLIYLDNETNVAGAEQENFARELMELFTVGVGNFSEADVVAMAKAWTGHNTRGFVNRNGSWVYDPTYVYNKSEHDGGFKTLWGIRKRWNGPDTIQELVHGSQQQLTARYIAEKLWKFLATGTPSEAVLNRLTRSYVASGMKGKALVKAVLLEDDFWSPDARYALMRSPVEYVVALMKVTGWTTDDIPVRWYMEPMGQILFNPPDVAGWGTNEYWLSTATAWARARFVTEWQWKIRDTPLLAGIEDLPASEAADLIFSSFDINEPSAETRAGIEAWVNAAHANKHSWSIQPNSFVLGALCPEFQMA